MFDPTIDREDAVELFQQLLVLGTSQRILRLLGQAKMGKSHLITRILPKIIEHHPAYCAIIDLRSKSVAIDSIMKTICEQIGPNYFPNYHQAFEHWSEKSNSPVTISGIGMIFSRLTVRYSQSGDESNLLIQNLRNSFIKDLEALNDRILVLIFDAVDEADEKLRTWLLQDLLISLSKLPHVRIVLAGRELPAVNGAYQRYCRNHDLKPIEKTDFYIQYCIKQNYTIPHEVVIAFAKVAKFAPGAFVEQIEILING